MQKKAINFIAVECQIQDLSQSLNIRLRCGSQILCYGYVHFIDWESGFPTALSGTNPLPLKAPENQKLKDVNGNYRKQHHNAMKFILLSSNYKRLTYNNATSNMYFLGRATFVYLNEINKHKNLNKRKEDMHIFLIYEYKYP